MKRRIAGVLSRVAVLACLACGDPADDPPAAHELALDSAQCSLGAECDRWGTLLADEPLSELRCPARQPATPPIWTQPLAGAACPFGHCGLYDQQLSLDADGSLVTLARVLLPSRFGQDSGEGGLWLTRHTSDGSFLRSKLLDFSAPPPGVELARHAALVRDHAGRTALASSRAVLPFDAARPLLVSDLSRALNTSSAFSTERGWGVSTAALANGEWMVASLRPLAPGRAQASLARHDKRGRAVWSRTWPERSEVRALLTTREQAIFALVAEPNNGTQTLHRLDRRGVVAWRRVVGSASAALQVVAAEDGNLFLARLEETDFSTNIHIEALTTGGQRVAAWLIPEVTFPSPTLATAASGEGVLALPSHDEQWLPVLRWYAFVAGDCQLSSYQWPSDSSAALGPVAVQAGRHGARFFASPQLIGQLREGEAP